MTELKKTATEVVEEKAPGNTGAATGAETEQAAAVPLAEFLAGAGTLTLDERKLLVDQALLLLEQNYVHLSLKAAMHAVNRCNGCG
jgi:hypothetical protein